jgi:opacity protein-like surface antigen
MKKIKSLAVGAAIIVAIQSTHSVADGPYIGIGIGQTASHYNVNRHMLFSRQQSSNLGKHGFHGGVFAGYNYLIKESPLLIGGEIGAQLHSLEASKEDRVALIHANYSTKVRASNSVTALMKMGFCINELVIYGKCGFAQTNFEMDYIDSRDASNPATYARKFKKDGLVVGGGVEYNINPNWIIGIDYAVSTYPNLKLNYDVGQIKVQPSLQSTTFRLSYVF